MFADLLDIVIPHTCVACKTPISSYNSGICTSCCTKLQVLCRGQDLELRKRLTTKAHLFDGGLALLYFEQNGVSQRLIHHIKYHHGKDLAITWGKFLGNVLVAAQMEMEIDFNNCVLIPIPMHRKKRRKRGYNPPLYIARGIQEVFGLRSSIEPDILVRTKHLKSQTSADFHLRFERLVNSFQLQNEIPIQGSIILIDDVITSTSTLQHCAQVLRKSYTLKIYAVALAFSA